MILKLLHFFYFSIPWYEYDTKSHIIFLKIFNFKHRRLNRSVCVVASVYVGVFFVKLCCVLKSLWRQRLLPPPLLFATQTFPWASSDESEVMSSESIRSYFTCFTADGNQYLLQWLWWMKESRQWPLPDWSLLENPSISLYCITVSQDCVVFTHVGALYCSLGAGKHLISEFWLIANSKDDKPGGLQCFRWHELPWIY